MGIEAVIKQIEGIEASFKMFQDKAEGEQKENGKISAETMTALDKIGEDQRSIADRLLAMEQKSTAEGEDKPLSSWGKQFVDSASYGQFLAGNTQKARFEVQNNTLTGSDTNVAPDRKSGIVGGAFQQFTLEDLIPSLPTSSNAIEFTKEASFTNSAAEATEGTEKGESALTWALVSMPISTVAHWIKISKQLAEDAPALAAYVNTRMAYGVDHRVESQLGAGNGVAPNISGLLDTGNFTAHGIADAGLGSVLKKFSLIRQIIGTLMNTGYAPNAILMNPLDWASMEIDLFQEVGNQVRVSTTAAGQPTLFGLPVVQSFGITADQFLVGAFDQASTIHNRSGVAIELSDSDADNFTTNLITVRAERRLALTVEKPAAIIGGDLTPV